MKKVILLLGGGLALGLTGRPDVYFRIIRGIVKEWKRIDREALHNAIRNLYKSKFIEVKEDAHGTVTLTLSENGKKEFLRYNLDTIKIKKPSQWDGWWRVILFDIPEHKKKARDAFVARLKQLGFLKFQKSVFLYPYECRNELNFLIEFFELRPFVRILLAKETDVDLELKNHFRLR